MTSSTCETLRAQVPVPEGWIDAVARGPIPFIVPGDINRRFNVPQDQVWTELDDGEPANADLTTVRIQRMEEELGALKALVKQMPH
jgi:hypothetical protein